MLTGLYFDIFWCRRGDIGYIASAYRIICTVARMVGAQYNAQA